MPRSIPMHGVPADVVSARAQGRMQAQTTRRGLIMSPAAAKGEEMICKHRRPKQLWMEQGTGQPNQRRNMQIGVSPSDRGPDQGEFSHSCTLQATTNSKALRVLASICISSQQEKTNSSRGGMLHEGWHGTTEDNCQGICMTCLLVLLGEVNPGEVGGGGGQQ